jgi:hypothetical protein
MARLPRLLAVPLLLVGSAAPTSAFAGDSAEFAGFATMFRKEMDGKAEARLRAVRRAGEVVDDRVPGLLFEGEERETTRRAAIEKARGETGTALQALLDEVEKAQKATPRTPKEVTAFNARVRKLEARRDEATARLRDLATDAVQSDAVNGAIVGAMAKALDALPGSCADATFALATTRWGDPKQPAERRLRRVDLLAAVTKHPTGSLLRAIARDGAEDARVRAVAIDARIGRLDAGALEDAVALLAEPPGPVVAAAVDGLRRLHRREGIEPLIALLGREGLGRMREDARAALVSLTGQKHGPYRDPWDAWWRDAAAAFVMPEKPSDYADLVAPEKGVTFYGVTTFSDKILFVLDVSGSMKERAHEAAAGARGEDLRIDVARRELGGALAMLDEKKTFDIIFFGHKVIRWQGAMIPADRAAVDRARRFGADLEPSGGTNIHDALEAAFALAGLNADGKNYLSAVDTIYFLTDGTPTAGKLVKPADILEAVRGWNRGPKITIHVIGIGEGCDRAFLESLAAQNRGRFVPR